MLEQFDKKQSAWRWLKYAVKAWAPNPAYRHVLIVLSDFADVDGLCYPSYETLMERTGLGRMSVYEALKYWKSTGILKWEKGWGNIYKQVPNVYTFQEDVMKVRQTDSNVLAERPSLKTNVPVTPLIRGIEGVDSSLLELQAGKESAKQSKKEESTPDGLSSIPDFVKWLGDGWGATRPTTVAEAAKIRELNRLKVKP